MVKYLLGRRSIRSSLITGAILLAASTIATSHPIILAVLWAAWAGIFAGAITSGVKARA